MSDLKLSELKNTSKQWGMIIYDISDDGVCLHGIWTNTHRSSNGRVMNEIARKIKPINKDLDGEYTVSWIEEVEGAINGKLIITTISNNRINFDWSDAQGNSCFIGIGMQLSQKQIAVIYW